MFNAYSYILFPKNRISELLFADVVAVTCGLLPAEVRLRGEPSQVVVGVGDYIHLPAVVSDGGGEQPLHRVVGHRVYVNVVSRVGRMLLTDGKWLACEREVHIVVVIAPHGIAFMALNHIAMAVIVKALDKH